MTRTMLITGASSGIGRATAEAALADGWRVGLFARRQSALEEIEGETLVLPGDISVLADIEGAVAQMADAWGRIDVLFNNAGVFTPQGTINEIDIADWEKTVSVNITGMFYAARAAFAQMRRQAPMGGRIINNGSLSAHSPREGSVCYTMSKHAIAGLTKTLSLDGRPFDIACGQIDIGNARTPMVAALDEANRAAGRPEIPSMDVEHAAEAVLHMANLPASANVQSLTVLATKMPFVGRG